MGSAGSNETLNKFLHDLYTDKIHFKLSDIEVIDIREAVVCMVERIAKKIGDIDERLKINEVILVGSAKEGTQIIQPDEYDFLMVLETLSGQGAVSIKRVCPGKDNCVHVTLNNIALKALFGDLLQENEIRSTQDDRPIFRRNGLRQSLHCAISKAVKTVSGKVIDTSTGTLRLEKSIETHGPAFNPKLMWHRRNGKCFEISIDLCPVIRLSGNFPEIIRLDNVSCQTYYEYVQKMNSIMLLPCKRGVSCERGLCFSVICTEAEMLLMTDLSQHHRKCYKILKYLLNAKERPSLGNLFTWIENRVEPPTALFSYALKILVLDHQYKQKCNDVENLANCVLKLLLDIDTILHKAKVVLPGIPPRNWLSNPFCKSHNIWSSHSLRFVDSNLEMRMKYLYITLIAISKMQAYKYDTFRVQSVRETDLNKLALPLVTTALVSTVTVYIFPELGHLSEEIFAFLIWKYIDLGRIIWFLLEPIESKNKKQAIENDNEDSSETGFGLPGIYFIIAVEASVFSIFVYPELGHLAEDMTRVLTRKCIDLLKQI